MKRLTNEVVTNTIRSKGLKMTPQRLAIVEYLKEAHHHPSADEVLKEVNAKFPMTSRATVYNTLNWLRDTGLIQEIFEGGTTRFDPNTSQHHHFVCRKCSVVQDIDWEMVGPLPQCTLDEKQTIESYEITFRGLCNTCLEKPQ